jgi:hypothetical protein
MHAAVFYQVGAGRSNWRQKLKNPQGIGNSIVLGTVFLDKAKLKFSQVVFPFTRLGSLLV